MIVMNGFFSVVILILGILLPALKRMKCTKPVTAIISNKREVLAGGRPMVRRTQGEMSYTCDGCSFTVSIYLPSGLTDAMPILVNPRNPQQWVTEDKNHFHWLMIGSAVLIVFLICSTFLF